MNDEILQKRTLDDDEYINKKDGLIYCSVCHTPRQHRVQFGERVFLPTIMCTCQRECFEAEEKAREDREQLMRVSRLKSVGLQDKALRAYTFANDNGLNPEISKARKYVDNWGAMKEDSIGLLLWGDVGTGKTFFAGCIANALLEKEIPVLMTNFSYMLNTLTGMYAGDRNEYISSLNRYSLLIIDDLGIERGSEFALEQIFNIIDSRCRSKLPLIITTNLTLGELKNPKDLAHTRIYDRVLECCVPLKINGQNIRKLNAEANKKKARELLLP